MSRHSQIEWFRKHLGIRPTSWASLSDGRVNEIFSMHNRNAGAGKGQATMVVRNKPARFADGNPAGPMGQAADNDRQVLLAQLKNMGISFGQFGMVLPVADLSQIVSLLSQLAGEFLKKNEQAGGAVDPKGAAKPSAQQSAAGMFSERAANAEERKVAAYYESNRATFAKHGTSLGSMLGAFRDSGEASADKWLGKPKR